MMIPVVDVGGQYNHLIYRIITELGAESEILGLDTTIEKLEGIGAHGLVMGGGPQRIDKELGEFSILGKTIAESPIPMLGICVTHQLIAFVYGGRAVAAKNPEYGEVEVIVDNEDEILAGLSPKFTALQTHNDEVVELPPDFEALAHSEHCRIQAMRHVSLPKFGVQFHPETVRKESDYKIFENFLRICKK
ncbi:MAG: gamma-glutamyl-gamma-aminobutyrate hydrolase family protein [Candidatus Micrarchaeota archaeon]